MRTVNSDDDDDQRRLAASASLGDRWCVLRVARYLADGTIRRTHGPA
jgi:hypothetical protein